MSKRKKLILIFYINVSNIYRGDMPEYMNEVASCLSNVEDGTDKYFIPIYESDSRVECINPVMISEKEYEEVKGKLEEFDARLKTAVKELFDKQNDKQKR